MIIEDKKFVIPFVIIYLIALFFIKDFPYLMVFVDFLILIYFTHYSRTIANIFFILLVITTFFVIVKFKLSFIILIEETLLFIVCNISINRFNNILNKLHIVEENLAVKRIDEKLQISNGETSLKHSKDRIKDYKYLIKELLDLGMIKKRKEMLKQLLKVSSAFFNGTGYILLFDDDKWNIIDKFGRETINLKSFNFSSGILKDVLIKKKTLFVNDIDSDYHYTFLSGIKDINSVIIFPILINYQVMGILKWDFSSPQEFAYHKVKIVQTLVHFTTLNLSLLQTMADLEKVSIVDQLTQTYNKKEFESRLKEFIKSQRKLSTSLALLMVDIDHFKKINDTYGHLNGDRVLVQLASILKKTVRISDIVCRYGGEEFAVILPDTDEQNGFILAERLRQKIEKNIFYLSEKTIRVAITIGISSLSNTNYTLNKIIEAADKALYYGKNNGRNRCIPYSKLTKKE